MDINQLLAAIASICAIFLAIDSWISKSDEAKAKTKAGLRKLGLTAYRSWAVVGTLGASAANVYEIYRFGSSTDPLTRQDVLVLLMHIWNSAFYGVAGLAIFALWINEAKKQKSKLTAE